ncbi:hypothetical protein QBC40DRAFT_169534 [Triangularia verruculosa]|uniref:Uncharacterized protein n=1 Tax=Triangularia verruculosa TaxID=2587418 RepID=A0AAN6XN90_9PEZI|nr:hypothetical protein QBC40DRAFT_169534 [Triangularia verruculosa]
MGQKSSCLAHKHSAPPGTASAEHHRQTENGTAHDLLQDIARKSKLQPRGMSADSPNGRIGSNSSKHISEQNGNAVAENETRERLNTTSTEDVDTETSFAPAVVQEVVKPHVHEIRQEEIHRDIHVHTNHTIIQPVFDLEALPPKHFVPDENGNLVEVSESDLPACTGQNAQWHIAAGPVPRSLETQQHDAPGNAALSSTTTGPDNSSGSAHDSDSVSLTDSVKENSRKGSYDGEAVPSDQKNTVPKLATVQAKGGKTKKSSRLPKPSTPAPAIAATAK